MRFRQLVPWQRGSQYPSRYDDRPLTALQERINSLFQDLTRSFPTPLGESESGWSNAPSLDVSESDEEVKVRVELPGVDEKDLELSFESGVLRIRGEKRSEEREEREEREGVLYTECSYGAFQRDVPLPADVDEGKIDASFKNGVLTVHLPKSKAASERVRKIKIKSGS